MVVAGNKWCGRVGKVVGCGGWGWVVVGRWGRTGSHDGSGDIRMSGARPRAVAVAIRGRRVGGVVARNRWC